MAPYYTLLIYPSNQFSSQHSSFVINNYFPAEIKVIPLVFLMKHVAELVAQHLRSAQIHVETYVRVAVNPCVYGRMAYVVGQLHGESGKQLAVFYGAKLRRRAE